MGASTCDRCLSMGVPRDRGSPPSLSSSAADRRVTHGITTVSARRPSVRRRIYCDTLSLLSSFAGVPTGRWSVAATGGRDGLGRVDAVDLRGGLAGRRRRQSVARAGPVRSRGRTTTEDSGVAAPLIELCLHSIRRRRHETDDGAFVTTPLDAAT